LKYETLKLGTIKQKIPETLKALQVPESLNPKTQNDLIDSQKNENPRNPKT
jgi:hypothetical protein